MWPLLKFHWGPPKVPGRLSFTHNTYMYKNCDEPIVEMQYAKPVVHDWPIRSWFGFAVLNRLFVGVIRIDEPK